MSEALHIVCLDAPAPPDYGGAIEMFYKIKALHEQGRKIILHYFDYKKGRGAKGLEAYCQEIHAYARGPLLKSLLQGQSYIVGSRMNKDLIDTLNADEHPVLLEGIHCAGIITNLRPGKKMLLRIHNDEAAYYNELARWEKNALKRQYFKREAMKLQAFQKTMPAQVPTAFLSESDQNKFLSRYGSRPAYFVPCFLPWQTVRSPLGKGDYCLYHGNISVSENRRAAEWLAEEVFSKLDLPLVVAGRDAGRLKTGKGKNLRLVNDPSNEELEQLIGGAQMNLLPSFNNTGVKIKLLHALLAGRFCITNAHGLEGSGIETGVLIANDADSMIQLVSQLADRPFTAADIAERQKILALYDNRANAKKLSELL